MSAFSKKRFLALLFFGFAILGANRQAFASESKTSVNEATGVLDSTLNEDLVQVTFMYLGREERTVRVSPLTDLVIRSDFSTLVPYIAALEKKYFVTARKDKDLRRAQGIRLCVQFAKGIILAQRMDLLEDILAMDHKTTRFENVEFLNSFNEKETTRRYERWSADERYKEFLDCFVRTLWLELLKEGNEDLLTRVHEAHYLAPEMLPALIDEVVVFVARSSAGNAEMRQNALSTLSRFIGRYHEFGFEAAEGLQAFRKRDILTNIKGRIDRGILSSVVESLKKAPAKIGSDPDMTKDLPGPKTCVVQSLAAMVSSGISDACILRCMKLAKPNAVTLIKERRIPTALFLLESKRYELFTALLATGAEPWLLDGITLHRLPLRHVLFDLLVSDKALDVIARLLNSTPFYGTKADRVLLLDKVIKAIKSKSVTLDDMVKSLGNGIQPFLQNLMLRAMETNDSDAMVFLLQTNLLDLNQTEYTI